MAAIEIRMPEFSGDETEADLITWLVAPGDRVAEGDLIAEIETDKATVEFEAPAGGTVRELAVAEGTTVKVGELLAILDAEAAADSEPPASGAEAPPALPGKPDAPAPDAQRAANGEHHATADVTAAADADADADGSVVADAEAAAADAAEPAIATAAAPPRGATAGAPGATSADAPATEPAASALARRIAAQQGVALGALAGSGARGRIVKADVEAALTTGSAAAAMPAPSATFRLETDCDADGLMECLEGFGALDESERPGIAPFALRALSLALRDTPEARVVREGAAVRPLEACDVAVVVSGPGGDALVGIADPGVRGLVVVAQAMRDAGETELPIAAASLSMVGSEAVARITPALRPPCCSALGVGAPAPQPVVRDGEIAIATRVHVSLTVDAGAIDESVAMRLLHDFKRRIEDPLSMIL